MLIFFLIIVILGLSGGLYFALKKAKETSYYNEKINSENKRLDSINQNLKGERINLINDIESKKEQLNLLQQNITNNESISNEALKNYYSILEKAYEEKEAEYNKNIETLNDSYSKEQQKILDKLQEEKEELEKIQSTRIAAIEANLREKEIEEDLSFFCLQISDNELTDIGILESIKPKLNNPRILSMLIWQTYWQKPMNSLCSKIIGVGTKCGIYKITNIKTKECYIGQAVDIASRWKQHAKCGLGIDTPPANKLYKAIQEYGIWNFSWEFLEECSSKDLNEKEKYYIDLYKSKDYGYNSNKGVSKKEVH